MANGIRQRPTGRRNILNSHKPNMNKGGAKTTKKYITKGEFSFYMDTCPLPAAAHKQAAHTGTGGPL